MRTHMSRIVGHLTILLSALFSTSIASAIPGAQIYGGPENDYALSIQQTSDDGYVAAGLTVTASIGRSAGGQLYGNPFDRE